MSFQMATRPNALPGALAAGTRLGRYEIVSLLGTGTMGEVYRARDNNDAHDVALKILHRTGELKPDRLERIMREARVLALLSHPNIAVIHGVEDFELGPAIILELVEGPTLAEQIIDRRMMGLTTSLSIASQLAAALESAHERGVVHRDLKPANIMVTPHGMVKLVDFGVATTIAEEVRQRFPHTTAHGIATVADVIIGTPSYMSPEQTRGECVDQRTDIWAFGCVLYELLTGARAFAGETIVETFTAVREREPDLRRLHSTLPACTRQLLRMCLEKDLDRRLPDIVHARTAIDDARHIVERSSRPLLTDVARTAHPGHSRRVA